MRLQLGPLPVTRSERPTLRLGAAAFGTRFSQILRRVAEPVVARFLAKGGPVFAPFFEPAFLAALNEALGFLERRRVPPKGGPTAAWLAALAAHDKLDPLREVCAAHHEPALGPVVAAAMCPAAGTEAQRARAPICISWLRGWPHMARPGGMRLTFVPGLQPQPKTSAAGLDALRTFEAERARTVRRAVIRLPHRICRHANPGLPLAR